MHYFLKKYQWYLFWNFFFTNGKKWWISLHNCQFPLTPNASEIPNFRKTVIKYNLEEYFGIDVQMKVIESIDVQMKVIDLRSWIFDTIYIFKFTNAIIKIQKFFLNLIANKILTFLE
jgi:hypothetical protein